MISISKLSKSYKSKVLFRNINYNFPQKGIIALIGVNGAGKTTLLNILCGIENPDSGEVVKMKTKTIGYLPQEPNPNPEETVIKECVSGNEDIFAAQKKMQIMEEDLAVEYCSEKWEKFEEIEIQYRNKGGYAFENAVSKILKGLGFSDKQLQENPENLSGGWRMRLEVGKLLAKNPDFLILDEPTNYLDLPSIEWLEGYLKKFPGTVLFVSHDESLLNRLPNMILHLKNGEFQEYQGNYDDFLEQYEAMQSGKAADIKNLDKKIAQLSKFVNRFKAKASLASQARSKMKIIAKLQEQANSIKTDDPNSEIAIKIPLTEKSGKEVVFLENAKIGYDKPLSQKFSLTVLRGQKIAIIGANGLGKSTLIKTIANEMPLLEGNIKMGHKVKVAYFAQEQKEFLEMEKSVFENIKQVNPKITDQKIRAILGSFLFKSEDINKPIKVLSGGEKTRLRLACLLLEEANFLLLDEPTNHLDILSTEVLGEALSSYEGTVMFVSHNRTFINTVATDLITFTEPEKNVLNITRALEII